MQRKIKSTNRKAKICIRFVFVPLFFIFAGLLTGVYVVQKILDEELLLKNELRRFVVPSVVSGGVAYTVESGQVASTGKNVSVFTSIRVLRIAYASVINRLDPLFGMEGTDAAALANSVKLLTASKASIVDLYKKEDRELLEKGLYPTAFLSSLARTENARQKLIAYPSAKVISVYYQTLAFTLTEYQRYLVNVKHVYGELPKETYVFFAGESSPERYLSAFVQLEDAAMRNVTELRRRTRCARKFSTDCPSLSDAFRKLNHFEVAPPLPRAEVPFDVFTHKMILDNAEDILHPKRILQEVLVETDPSVCEGGLVEPATYYELRWAQEDTVKYNKTVLPKYLNDIYFFNLAQADNLFLQMLKENGARYAQRRIDYFYICPDIGSRYAELETIAALRDSLQSVPLADDRFSEAARILEMRIAHGALVRKSDVSSYLAILSDVLLGGGEKAAANLLGQKTVMRAESLLSMYHTQSGYFDSPIRSVYALNQVIRKDREMFRRQGRISFPIQFLFATRNFPMWFLLAHNKSVISTTPLLLTPFPFDNEHRLVSHKTVLKYMYTPQKMLELLIEGVRAENKLYEDAALKNGQ